MTPLEIRILEVLANWSYAVAPTLREVATRTSAATGEVAASLERLDRRGLVTFTRTRRRFAYITSFGLSSLAACKAD